MTDLCLHCGSHITSLEALERLPKPPSLGARHRPLAHHEFVKIIVARVEARGLEIQNMALGLNPKETHLFGLLDLASATDDFTTILGFRQSTDKTLAASVAIGSQVFVCDNLCFSGEFKCAARHTANIIDTFSGRVDATLEQVLPLRDQHAAEIALFKEYEIRGQLELDHLLMQGLRAGAYPGDKITRILKEFVEPRHPEFKGGTMWTFMNAVTEILKPTKKSRSMFAPGEASPMGRSIKLLETLRTHLLGDQSTAAAMSDILQLGTGPTEDSCE